MSDRQAGHVEIHAFVLYDYARTKKVDVRMLVGSISIEESTDSPSVRGTATIVDSADLIKNFPLVCEEFLMIDYSDFFEKRRQDHFMVYAITDVRYGKETDNGLMSYKLNFVSVPKVLTEGQRVRRAYRRGTVSSFVQQAFDQYFRVPMELSIPEKRLILEPTMDEQSYTVPNLTPEQTMQFFSRRAWAASSPSQSYRFFESRDSYFFATTEFIRSQSLGGGGYGIGAVDPRLADAVGLEATTMPVYTVNYAPGFDPRRQQHRMYELVDVSFGQVANTIEDIRGGYKRRLSEIDMKTGLVESWDYDYTPPTQGYAAGPTEVYVHTERFLIDRMERRERFAAKDTTNYPDLYNVKPMHLYHRKQNSVYATVYGRNDLQAGKYVTLQLYEHSAVSPPPLDYMRSGEYLVESVESNVNQNVFTQKLRLSRAGYTA